MPLDKAVDSSQLNSDLTSVANAIRTKGGTSASLAFPAGFLSAIQAIPTGGATLQSKTRTYTPTTSQQQETVAADTGYDGLSSVDVTVNRIPTQYIIPSGAKSITANGNGIDVMQYETVNVNVPQDATYSVTKSLTGVTTSNDDTKVIAGNSFYMDLTPTSGALINSVTVTMGGVDITSQVFKPGTTEKAVTANGTYNASSDNASGYSRVVVNVPNSYSASDEGKVVSSGALVSQTSDTVTSNATYDTTLINSLTVNVSGGAEVTSYVVDKAGSGSNSISLDIPFTPSAIIYFELDPMTAGSFVSTTHRVMGIYVSDYPRQLYANQGNTTRGGYLSATSSTTHSYSNGVFTVGGSSVVLLSTRTYRFIAVK